MGYKSFVNGNLFTTSDADALLMSQVIIRCTSTTRPDQPSEGWHIYETDTQRLKIFQNGLWIDDPGTNQDVWKVKSSDETYSSTSDHNDAELFVNVTANTRYALDCFLIATCATAGNYLDFDFGIPTYSNVYLVTNHPLNVEEGTANKLTRQTGAISMTGYVQSAGSATQVKGLLQVGSLNGFFAIVWRTTNASNPITMKALSAIRLRRIG